MELESTTVFPEELSTYLQDFDSIEYGSYSLSFDSCQTVQALSTSSSSSSIDLSDDFKTKAFQFFSSQEKSGIFDEVEWFDLLRSAFGNITLAESNLIYAEISNNVSGAISFEEFFIGLQRLSLDGYSSPERREVDWNISSSEIIIEEELGAGTFGTVYRCQWRGITAACKKLNEPEGEEVADLLREIEILSQLRHPNVISFLGSSSNHEYVLTEFVDGGNLEDALKSNIQFDELAILDILRQVACGLEYLHSNNIVHRDIKLANILVSKERQAKICDFGLSCTKTPGMDILEHADTPIWGAPEMMLKEPYDESVDIFSFSLCSWELITHQNPFEGIETTEQLIEEMAIQGNRPAIPDHVRPEFSELISMGWDSDRKKRPDSSQVILTLEYLISTTCNNH